MNVPHKPGKRGRHNKPRKEREPVWMVVATTAGMAQASIIAGRLQSLGIPAVIHREALGVVLGLTIGMGQAAVVVPEKYYRAAMAILEPDVSVFWLGDGDDSDTEESDDDDDDGETSD